jgi:GTP-binding protein YchF
VVRAFEAADVPRHPGSASAEEDLLRLEEELILRDLERVEKRLQRLHKEGKKSENALECQLLEKLQRFLEAERPLREGNWSEEEATRLRGFQFLSLKPVLVVMNVDEGALDQAPAPGEARRGRRDLTFSARIEKELAELDAHEQREFLEQLGLQRPAREVFLRSAFELLDLLSFFTVGEDEVRAWPVRRGSTAPVAAGKIHSDLQKGFIRAEVIHYDEFVRLGSLSAARSQGLLRLEGKQYEVQDGDILHVRHA